MKEFIEMLVESIRLMIVIAVVIAVAASPIFLAVYFDNAWWSLLLILSLALAKTMADYLIG